MLQIISGKFFNSENRFRHDAKGILFSNFSWVQPIETCIAKLEPVDYNSSISSYVMSYINQIEKEKPPKKDVLVQTGDSEIIDQFKLLCSFSLGAFFHADRNMVTIACRNDPINSGDSHIPSRFVPRIFSNPIRGSIENITSLNNFVKQSIGLTRRDYNALIISLNSFYNAMQILGDNIDLSYSLLIYSIESLAQHSDKSIPHWEDYPTNLREKLDDILIGINNSKANNIRKILLKDSKLKAIKRFVHFIESNTNNTFFIEKAPSNPNAVRKSEFHKVLENAYRTRSEFTHQLKPIQEQLRIPLILNGDVFRFGKEPFLTISGLVRVVRHVINNFVNSQEKVEREQLDWRNELPGIVTMEMTPECWIWKHENLKPDHATKKLTGFLIQLESSIMELKPITDIRDLLNKYEKIIKQAKEPFKTQIFTTYFLYNTFVGRDFKCNNYKKIINFYNHLFDKCTIESMVVFLLYEEPMPWMVELCAYCFKCYQKRKHKNSTIYISPLIEISLMVEISSMYFKKSNMLKYSFWMKEAILESSGFKDIQEKIIKAKSEEIEVKGIEIINQKKIK